ncbi:HAAS signaling domain-containing protein [Rugosimonospora africana]|uniref:DUF1700 domain-containing protein n=1 Tax=Rugosimonospora africana TaxID=556532 RepID=A0A8J3R1D0_9ACTN|nr:hypothetical protein [Rugosimonospora africana]GIH20024.1 hypothetical protein Raf01_81960 [Rugosimonospora africana]
MPTSDTLIADYLERLRRASVDLPAGSRAELMQDIGAHLAEKVDATASEVQVRRVLDELGTPEEIAAVAADQSGARPSAGAGGGGGGGLAYDTATVLVLLLGGFVIPVLGWIAGVVMLWNGPRWDARHKWAGTLIWPAAIVFTLMVLTADHRASGHLGVVVVIGLAVVVAGLVAGFGYLLRGARSSR